MKHVGEISVDPVPVTKSILTVSAREMVLAVAGAECPNCANRIRNAVVRVRGVVDASVDPRATVIRVWHQRDDDGLEREIMTAIQEAAHGTPHRYLAVPLRTRFNES